LATVSLVALALVVAGVATTVTLPGPRSSAAPSNSWTVYHANPAGTGRSTTRAVATQRPKWTSRTLDGLLYGEPLVWSGRVFVATENNTVYALSSTNGSVMWARHVGPAVPSSSLPCGNISPLVGITSTPVIDRARNEIFVVAEESLGARAVHVLVGLNAATGSVMLTKRIDPAKSDSPALLQRSGLALDRGRVIVAFGGLYGDCGNYHGTVEAVPESGGISSFYIVAARNGQSQGAVWMGGAAPIVDPKGDIWVSVGNGSSTSSTGPYDYSDSMLDLSANLHLRQYFAPSSWAQDNASDLDMSMAPALLANGQVVVSGKSRIIYLLNGAHLGGIGHEESSLASGCSQDIDGGPAVAGAVVYLPCLSGTIAVRVSASPLALRVLWTSSAGGGPPIVTAGEVWTIGSDGALYGLNQLTGAVRQRATIGATANHFPTPSVGGGLLLVATSTHVVAFASR
jgi:polyvinyl alcohol dehydrogenase (cytochrome)